MNPPSPTPDVDIDMNDEDFERDMKIRMFHSDLVVHTEETFIKFCSSCFGIINNKYLPNNDHDDHIQNDILNLTLINKIRNDLLLNFCNDPNDNILLLLIKTRLKHFPYYRTKFSNNIIRAKQTMKLEYCFRQFEIECSSLRGTVCQCCSISRITAGSLLREQISNFKWPTICLFKRQRIKISVRH